MVEDRTLSADYCNIKRKPCEHRYNMSGNNCIECRTLLQLGLLAGIKKSLIMILQEKT